LAFHDSSRCHMHFSQLNMTRGRLKWRIIYVDTAFRVGVAIVLCLFFFRLCFQICLRK
jgi:hypothetical protein